MKKASSKTTGTHSEEKATRREKSTWRTRQKKNRSIWDNWSCTAKHYKNRSPRQQTGRKGRRSVTPLKTKPTAGGRPVSTGPGHQNGGTVLKRRGGEGTPTTSKKKNPYTRRVIVADAPTGAGSKDWYYEGSKGKKERTRKGAWCREPPLKDHDPKNLPARP